MDLPKLTDPVDRLCMYFLTFKHHLLCICATVPLAMVWWICPLMYKVQEGRHGHTAISLWFSRYSGADVKISSIESSSKCVTQLQTFISLVLDDYLLQRNIQYSVKKDPYFCSCTIKPPGGSKTEYMKDKCNNFEEIHNRSF